MATEVIYKSKTICFMNEESFKAFTDLQSENERLKKVIEANEEICRQRNIELQLHQAAKKAAKSGLKSDLNALLKLKQTLKGE